MKEVKFKAVANPQNYLIPVLNTGGFEMVPGNLVQVEDIELSVHFYMPPNEKPSIQVNERKSAGEIYQREVSIFELLRLDSKDTYLRWIENIALEAIRIVAKNNLTLIRVAAVEHIIEEHKWHGEKPQLVELENSELKALWEVAE